MNNPQSDDNPVSWTWADLISTYRFWGLLAFYLLSMASSAMLSSYLPMFLVNEVGRNYADVGMRIGLMSVGGIFGFYVAWAAARWKTVPMLILAGLIQMLGGLLITIPGLAAVYIFSWAGPFLFGLGVGAITLAVPSVISGARGGTEIFVVSFGIIIALTSIAQIYAPAFMASLLEQFGYAALRWSVAMLVFMGVLLLLGVKASLFNEPPPRRGVALAPTQRAPLITALLCLFPFYWLYWLYRAHGEVTSLAPSRGILSPRAAVLANTFIPFVIYPVVLVSLNDALNQCAVGEGRAPYRSSGVIFVWSVVCLPAAIGLIQSTINRALVEASTPPAGM